MSEVTGVTSVTEVTEISRVYGVTEYIVDRSECMEYLK